MMSASTPRQAQAQLRSLLRYAAAYGTSSLALKGLTFVAFLLVARTLSVEEFGRFGVLYALQAGVATFAVAGLAESVIGSVKERPNLVARQTVYSSANALFIVMGATAVCVAAAVAAWLLTPRTQAAALGLAAGCCGALAAFAALQADFRRIEEDHRGALAFTFFVPILGQMGGLAAILFVPGVAAYFLGLGMGMIGAAALVRWRRVGWYKIRWRDASVQALRRQLPPYFVIATIGWLSGYGTNLPINAMFDAAVVSRFTFAFTLASLMQLVATSLNQVWGPRFFRLVRESPDVDVEMHNRQFFRWQAVAMGAVGAVAMALLPVAAAMIGGNVVAYGDIQLELLCLFAAYIVFSPWWQCQLYFLAHGRGTELVGVVARTAVLGFPLWIGAMSLVGPLGIYVGYVLHLGVRMLGVLWVARRHWPVHVAWEGIAVGLGLLAAGYSISPR